MQSTPESGIAIHSISTYSIAPTPGCRFYLTAIHFLSLFAPAGGLWPAISVLEMTSPQRGEIAIEKNGISNSAHPGGVA